MNNLICDKKKKPLKSYDFKGFNSICFSAGGEIDSSKLIATNANVIVTGSGEIKVNCTTILEAKVSGSGTIKYKKNPESVDKVIAGSGEIIAY
ncbi:DUF2807 domain-containing protein [uncultured Flavobacterium sp.]|uniref:GIN domain-containing protein n=1 Tax=uncultured Flavobacterium sp. TaxID=165435 RepID=UPI002593B2D0|nr:DUF2807 domain-containing protein [uncultured Flavobacterium sp.]